MATIADSIGVIRAYLTDPSGVAWTDAQVLRAYNFCRREMYSAARLSVKAVIVPTPPPFEFSCCFEWEERQVQSPCWRPFWDQGDYCVSSRWEVGHLKGTNDGSRGEHGSASVPAELVGRVVDNMVVYPLPADFHLPLMGMWDGVVLPLAQFRQLETADDYILERTGEPWNWSIEPWMGPRKFMLLPRPDTESLVASGEGALMYVSSSETLAGDTSSRPVVTVFGLEPDLGSVGAVTNLATIWQSFTLFYIAIPPNIESQTEEDSLSQAFRRYLEYATAAFLLKASTELRHREKGEFLAKLYELGVTLIEKAWGRMNKWTNHMLGPSLAPPRLGRPKLPDHYPRAW